MSGHACLMSGLVFVFSELVFLCLGLYVGCLALYCGCLDLYFGCLDLYVGCLNLYLGVCILAGCDYGVRAPSLIDADDNGSGGDQPTTAIPHGPQPPAGKHAQGPNMPFRGYPLTLTIALKY